MKYEKDQNEIMKNLLQNEQVFPSEEKGIFLWSRTRKKRKYCEESFMTRKREGERKRMFEIKSEKHRKT